MRERTTERTNVKPERERRFGGGGRGRDTHTHREDRKTGGERQCVRARPSKRETENERDKIIIPYYIGIKIYARVGFFVCANMSLKVRESDSERTNV